MADKFEAMIAKLARDPNLSAQFAKSPAPVLKQFGVDANQVEKGTPEAKAADARAKTLLKTAGVTASDGAVVAMQKLSRHAPRVFKKGHDVKVEPFAFSFTERTDETDLTFTATGSVRCTFSPWDGCRGDREG
jgi:hypothetical protein